MSGVRTSADRERRADYDGWPAARGPAGPLISWVDFYGIASLIDTVAGSAPKRLATLLNVLSSSSERLEARVVVELALQCRDPLSSLSRFCRDALKTATDLDALVKIPQWLTIEDVCHEPRAQALLNLCEAALANDSPHHRLRRQQIRRIRPRIKAAASEERTRLGEQIRRHRRLQLAAAPHFWQLLETFVTNDRKADRAADVSLPI